MECRSPVLRWEHLSHRINTSQHVTPPSPKKFTSKATIEEKAYVAELAACLPASVLGKPPRF